MKVTNGKRDQWKDKETVVNCALFYAFAYSMLENPIRILALTWKPYAVKIPFTIS